MTGAVFTIGMCIGRFTTLVTMGNDFSCNRFTQPFVENKIFSAEFIFKSLRFYRIGIMNNTSFQMEYLFEIHDAADRHWLFHSGCHRYNT